MDLHGIRFLGATLWTDFACLGQDRRLECIQAANRRLNDYRLIEGPSRKVLEAFDTLERHNDTRAWLAREIDQSPLPVVVITHHSPSLANKHPGYPEDPLTPSFHSNLESLFKPPVKAWISGHTHHSAVVSVNGIPLYSNQRGYPRERGSFDWDACFRVVP